MILSFPTVLESYECAECEASKLMADARKLPVTNLEILFHKSAPVGMIWISMQVSLIINNYIIAVQVGNLNKATHRAVV